MAEHFSPVHLGPKLGDQLSYGREMSYDARCNCASRVQAYLDLGVDRRKPGEGAFTASTCASAAATLDCGGGMAVFDVQNTSQAYVKAVWPDATVAPGCLR